MNFSGISNHTLVGRILRQPLRLIPDNAPLPILQGRLRGKRWIAGAHTHGCWLGSYENEKQRAFESVVQPGSTVFDIGANAGFYTLLASVLVGSSGRVYAFEPLPRNIQLLREHLRINEIKNAEVIEAAVSDQSGAALFDDVAGSAMGRLAESGGLSVRTIRIDDLVSQAELPPPDCLKIDVEGGEFLVLSGAQSTIGKHRPKILLATHGSDVHQRCCGLLRGLGYQIEGLGGQDVAQCDELLAYYSR
jgi:FkbM family methyltransferase